MNGLRFNPPPGWPAPPAGWAPDRSWQPDSMWPEAPPNWSFWLPVGAPPSPFPAYVAAPPPPRGKGPRIFLTCGIVLSPLLVWGIFAAIAAASIDPGNYANSVDYNLAMEDAGDAVGAVAMLVYLIVYALLARKVSYRWFDTFLQLIPIYGIIWQFIIAWRLAYLPHRDWRLRPEEKPWLRYPVTTQTYYGWPPYLQYPPTPYPGASSGPQPYDSVHPSYPSQGPTVPRGN